MRFVPILLIALLTPGDVDRAATAYAEGRFAEAHALYREASESRASPSAELLFDRALAALQAGDYLDAEVAAERAVAAGGSDYTRRRDFLFGNVAHARCLRAKLATLRPDAEPSAFEPALAEIEGAIVHWRRAAEQGPDWPAARRNLERALLERDELLLRQDMSLERARVPDTPQENPDTPPPGQDPPPPQDQEPPAVDRTGNREGKEREAEEVLPLRPDQLAKILEVLGEKEREKLRVRRAVRARRSADVEKDW